MKVPKLHLISKDAQNANLQCVFLHKGYLMTTDGRCMIVACLNDVAANVDQGDFGEDAYELEGKAISLETWIMASSSKCISIKFNKNDIELVLVGAGRITAAYLNNTMPGWEGVIKPYGDGYFEETPLSKIAMWPYLITKVMKVMEDALEKGAGVEMRFVGRDKGMLVIPSKEDNSWIVGLLMPMIDENPVSTRSIEEIITKLFNDGARSE